MTPWKALRLASAGALLAGAIGTSWITALRSIWSERVEELAHRGLVRSVAERRAPREPAAVEIHRRLDERLAALAARPEVAAAATILAESGTRAADDAQLYALVGAGEAELAALDALLSEPATADMAESALPSAPFTRGRERQTDRAAVLGLAARAALAEGPVDGAPRFGRALDLVCLLDDGSALSVVVSGELEACVLGLVLRALDDGADGRALARELEPRLSALASPGRAERALRYDMDAFVSDVREASGTARPSARGIVGEAFRYGEFHSWIDEYERCVDLARLSPPDLLARAREDGMRPAHRLPDWAPGYPELVDSIEVARARLALARAGLALEARRAETGAWPADLSGLDEAMDPHSGEPFPYTASGGHAVLGPPAWASGEAWTDDARRAALLLWERDG